MICHKVLRVIVVLVRTLVRVAREVVRTVCGWITSTITVLREVCENVCSWLPWPLDKLCELVCKVIEVLETVTKWVCEEVIETIFEWVERVLEWIFFVFEWICWAIDWVLFRWISLLLCRLGFRPRRVIHVCVKVVAEDDGTPAVPLADVVGIMEDADALLDGCEIDLVVIGTDVVVRPDVLEGTTCGIANIFTEWWTWFNRTACQEACTATVFFVRDLDSGDPTRNLNGCAIPGDNWVRVDNDADGATVVHEIGHLADLWGHTDDPDNIMTNQPGGTGDQITEHQCCMIRSSRYTCVNERRVLRGIADTVGETIAPLTPSAATGLRGGPPESRVKPGPDED